MTPTPYAAHRSYLLKLAVLFALVKDPRPLGEDEIARMWNDRA